MYPPGGRSILKTVQGSLAHAKQDGQQGDKTVETKERNPMIGGLILVAIGVLALLASWMPETFGSSLPMLILGGLGLIFIIAGIATRESGFFIPGGILSGLGLSMAFGAGPLSAYAGSNSGATFLLAFAAGWLLIPILSVIFTHERHLWALIPAAIIGLTGLAVANGGRWLEAFEWLGRLWPLALIAGGIYALYRARHPAEEVSDEKPVEKHA
jgi:hypothetical protein